MARHRPFSQYNPTHPGLVGAQRCRGYRVPTEDKNDALFPASPMAEQATSLISWRILPGLSYAPTLDGLSASVTDGPVLYTLDGDPAGNAIEWGANGLILRTSAISGDDVVMRMLVPFTPAADMQIGCRLRAQVDDADKVGFLAGVFVTSTDPINTDGTDLVVVRKAPTATAAIGRARGNAGTASDSATLATIEDAVEFELGFNLEIQSGATAYGSWWNGSTETKMDADDIAQINLLLTSPQLMYAMIAIRTGEAVLHTMTIADAWINVARAA